MKCGNMNENTQYGPDGLLRGSAHVDSGGWGVRSFCDGEVYPDPTTIQLHAIGSFLCLAANKHIN